MSSTRLQAFRSFLTEKFTNVAVEIFGEVETIVETYYEENKRMRTILQTALNPEIQLSKIDVGQHTGATPDVRKQTPQLNTWVQPEGAEPLPKEEQIESVQKNSAAGDLLTACVKSEAEEEENINMPFIINSFNIPAADLQPDSADSHSGAEVIYGHEDISSVDCDVVAGSLTPCRSEGGTTECGEPQNNLKSGKIKSKHLSTKQTLAKPCLQKTKLDVPSVDHSGVGECPQTFNDAPATLPSVLQLTSQRHCPAHGLRNAKRLIRVKHKRQQRYVKLDDTGGRLDFLQFHEKVIERFSLPPEADVVYKDSTGTEVSGEIFSDLVRQGNMVLTVLSNNESSDNLNITTSESSRSRSTLTLDEIPVKRQRSDNPPDAMLARQETLGLELMAKDAKIPVETCRKLLVEGVLKGKPGGEQVLQQYQATDTLTDATRRQMVNILVAHMIDTHGLVPTKSTRELYALGIVMLFPSLKDPYSQKGYEYFYDATSNTGYIAWRLKTVQRKRRQSSTLRSNSSYHVLHSSMGGPECQRATNLEGQLDGDACNEAVSLLKHTTDKSLILQKMRETFQHRQKLVSHSDSSADIFFVFPRFLDTEGLVHQDFTLLFGDETSSRFLEKWDMFFRPNVIKEAKRLTSTPELSQLVLIAESPLGRDPDDTRTCDQEMSSILLLLHLLPPPPGTKSPKISARDAGERLVTFYQSTWGLEEKVSSQTRRHPYLVAVGCKRSKIDSFYIAVDKRLVPCRANRFLGAFDELFKAHFVFSLSYDAALVNFYTFLQTTVYNIDVGKMKESPRVRDLRAKLLNQIAALT